MEILSLSLSRRRRYPPIQHESRVKSRTSEWEFN